jgi:diguanylate cyclase (GGDEF)-like protein/PAS domain S-box-containing protein
MHRIKPDRLSTSPRIGYVVLAGAVLVYLSWQAFHWLPFEQAPAGDFLFLPISVAAAWLSWRASRRAAASRRLRRAWLLVALAVAGQTLGTLAQIVFEDLLKDSAYPSVADAFYLSFYPLMLAGVLSFPAMRRSGRQALELILDCAIVAVGGSALVFYFVLGPEAVAGSTALEAAVTIAYPAGDMILLVGLGAAVLRTTMADVRISLRWLAAAIGLFIVGDLIYGYVVLHGSYEGGDPVDATYFLAFACFIVAAMKQVVVIGSDVVAPRDPEERVSWMPYLAVAACLAILIVEELGHPFLPGLAIAMIVVMATALVMARQLTSLGSLRQSQERLAQAQELSQLGSWEWDVERDRIEISNEEARILGMERPPVISFDSALQIVHADDRESVERAVSSSLASGKPLTLELRIVRPDGEVRTLLGSGEVEMHGGHAVRIRGTHLDITERKQMEIQLQHQADHDPLTGLLNRRRFSAELDRALRYAARYGRSGAVLMLDIDNFKFVNDAHGHATGDKILKAVAEAIMARARETDVVSRLGGDEFAIVIPEADEQQAIEFAEGIRAAVGSVDVAEVSHLSVGIAPFNGGRGLVADDVLIAADVALYEAKDGGKDQVRVYSGESGTALTWVERIHAALAEERFVLYAQPMIDLESGRTTHRELLIRMLADDGDLIPPAAFLPTAERFGLSKEIDRWVTGEGLELARQGEPVSINLSAPSIGDEEILAAVRAAILDGVPPDNLIFEITETAAMTNMDAARSFAEALGGLGCNVALDDFGTGFGSFSYLKHLPTRYLKIDAEFVRDMAANPTDRQVVKSIAEVAHSLGKLTVAEGVDNRDTLRLLREYGVDRAQGYFIGRPQRISRPTAFERDLAARTDGERHRPSVKG